MTRTVGRFVVLAAMTMALVATTSAATPTRPHHGRWDRAVDTVAAAHPAPARAQVEDHAFDIERTRGRTTSADATATSSATCDGCDAAADALEIVYARSHRTDATNVAVAWSAQCSSCGAAALSVQVVVLSHGQQIRVDNRALATNGGCRECRAHAAAYQLVVATERHARLSWSEVQQLRRWVSEQAEALTTPTLARSVVPRVTPSATELEGLVNGSLGSSTVAVDVQLQHE